jgi:hypothetical protein
MALDLTWRPATHSLSPLFHAGLDVITQVRLVEEASA